MARDDSGTSVHYFQERLFCTYEKQPAEQLNTFSNYGIYISYSYLGQALLFPNRTG